MGREQRDGHEAPGPRGLIVKAALLATPMALLLGVYLVLDPFAVLRRPADFYPARSVLPRNRDYVSTEMLLAQGPSHHYDAFILGSSRSLPYLTADWAKHIGANARPFHFDTSLESLFGVWSKVQFLDRSGYQLREVLMVADRTLLSRPTHDDKRPLFRKHPTIANDNDNDGWFSFQSSLFQAFVLRGFFAGYLDYALFGKWRGYMNGLLQSPDDNFHQLPDTNDCGAIAERDRRIDREGERYFQDFAGSINVEQAGVPSPPAIGERSRERLEEMAATFRRHHSRVRIVISPISDRQPLNVADHQALERLFGPGTVWDFSGDNAITRDVHNYYDVDHYRARIARQIMAQAYSDAPANSAGAP